ncbi:MAG: hypothetical protein OXH16_13030 [Gemmatimonadetes bacterium]|nr:hypothetical protein [Gemmatimonadota bacterium]
MDKSYSITIKGESSGKTIRGNIPGEAWETLLGFCNEVDEFFNLIQRCGGLKVSGSVKIDFDDDSVELVEKSNIDILRRSGILHRLRPFILQGSRRYPEPFYFNKMVDLLSCNMRHPLMTQYFRSVKDVFSNKHFRKSLRITYGELMVNSEEVLMAWLNAYEYHRDDGKRKLIEEIEAVFPKESLRMIFMLMILEKIKIIFEFKGVISRIDKRGGFEI